MESDVTGVRMERWKGVVTWRADSHMQELSKCSGARKGWKRREDRVLFPVVVPILADCNNAARWMVAWVQSHETDLRLLGSPSLSVLIC